MTAASVTKILSSTLFSALKPVERWEAARRFDSNFMAERWFIFAGLGAISILVVVLFVISWRRRSQQSKAADLSFFRHALREGLSERECRILRSVADYAGLRQSEAVFTITEAFDRGAIRMMNESLGWQGTEENALFKAELISLREKLGFHIRPDGSKGGHRKSKTTSSRQIPVGKKLRMTRRLTREGQDTEDIECTLIRNDFFSLVVKSAIPLEGSAGDLWRVRYYFGASVWEFDTSMARCDGDVLTLNHSENIRFINRRRFLRAAVKMPALIAHFPFERRFSIEDQDRVGGRRSSDSSDSISAQFGTVEPPEFVPATLVELAGPGLLIRASLDAKTGDRVLIAFSPDEEGDNGAARIRERQKSRTFGVIEDVGMVRRTTVTEKGLLIGIELTSLSDSNVNKLIRLTNAASVKAGGASGKGRDWADIQEHVEEPVAV